MAILKVTFDPELRFEEIFNRNAGAYKSKFSSKLFEITKSDLLTSYIEKYCSVQTLAQLEEVDRTLAKEVNELFTYKGPTINFPDLARDLPTVRSPYPNPYMGAPYRAPPFIRQDYDLL